MSGRFIRAYPSQMTRIPVLERDPRRLGVFPLVAVAVGLPVAIEAPEAMAATYSGPDAIACSTPGSFTVDGQPGETFEVDFENCNSGASGRPYVTLTYNEALLSGSVASGATITSDQTVTFSIRSGAPAGTYAAAVTIAPSSGFSSKYGGLTITTRTSSPPVRTSSPPVWHQSYSIKQSMDCASGWDQSWAQWPNDGSGGYVCNRVVFYKDGVWLVSATEEEASVSRPWDGGTAP